MAAAIPASSPLELLDINDNDIGPAGAEALADALDRGLMLKTLRMRGNRIGDEGAAALGRALAKGPMLQELDVGGNQVQTPFPVASSCSTAVTAQRYMVSC